MEEIRLFSLIIPAFKQEKTIVKDIKKIQKVLSAFTFKNEIILVIDGLIDKTYEKAISVFSSKDSNVRIYSYKKNKGKGYAVRYGVLKAKGDVVGFIDAGMDIEASCIPILIDYMQLSNADIVIGSKLHQDSKIQYPILRRMLSWGYRTTTHLMFGFDIKDTQVGLKIF
ncbi:MAG: glycosyltransferase [bacterium]|nr:glycosyltransferase [bacterium]